jgi:hypothetical protein
MRDAAKAGRGVRMSDLEKAARQALELRQLAEKFSEGWHDGIKIDASDVMLLLDAANALEQQAEPAADSGNPSF